MDLLDHRGRALRLLVAAIVGGAAGVGIVAAFALVLDRDPSGGPAWFAMFTWSMTFVLVTSGTNVLLTWWAKRRWHLPIPAARVVRR
jgi:hypothetical protein